MKYRNMIRLYGQNGHYFVKFEDFSKNLQSPIKIPFCITAEGENNQYLLKIDMISVNPPSSSSTTGLACARGAAEAAGRDAGALT